MRMGHTGEVSSVLRPGIRTFKPRRSRITARQQRALDDGRSNPGVLIEARGLTGVWERGAPVVLDIGFGSAAPVVELAREFPGQTILAVDVHTPGIGDLVDRIGTEGLDRVYVMEADVWDMLPELPGPLAGVRSFFPDPWPKARHHKRRLVQPATVAALAEAVAPGGFWHIATDWAEYAESIDHTFACTESWEGGIVPRPSWRPVTHFERRAIREGRAVVDMWFTRI